jgi:hypothetical protein
MKQQQWWLLRHLMIIVGGVAPYQGIKCIIETVTVLIGSCVEGTLTLI